MSEKVLIDATIQSLRSVINPRFFYTERGYQGEFYCSLQNTLKEQGFVDGNRILEMEYQKSVRHGISQRPDIILHVPTEISGAAPTDNNFAVWALKHRASVADSTDDFKKLNQMFNNLNYPLGFFINIDSSLHHINSYAGDFTDRIVTFAVRLDGPEIRIRMAYWQDDAVIEKDC